MVHTVKMKKGISRVIILLPSNMSSLRGEISYKLNQHNEQSSLSLPEHASYQKGKLVLFVLIADTSLGRSMVWECYGNKGVFLHLLGP